MNKTVLNLNARQAKKFFLQADSYCNFDLPPYFNFTEIINKLNDSIGKKSLEHCLKDMKLQPRDLEHINYCLYGNKNGKYDWRKFELIHPVIYILLVNIITEDKNWEIIKYRFKQFHTNNLVECVSIPVVSSSSQPNKAKQIMTWWTEVEQRSIELSLKYQHLHNADISNYYPSIYTHSIDWSIRDKEIAKQNRRDNSVGSQIDQCFMAMNYGQTNGIPQGSVLMDFISELVLAYADKLLTDKISEIEIKQKDFKIIRYRDDYRIFTNNPRIGDEIIRLLTEVLISLGLRLNTSKTYGSQNVVIDSVKDDKLAWIELKYQFLPEKNDKFYLVEILQFLHLFASKYPNSGTVVKKLTELYEYLEPLKNITGNKKVMVAYLVDIAIKNPRAYPVCSGLLSKMFSLIGSNSLRNEIIRDIHRKLNQSPNTGFSEIWLQRMTINEVGNPITFKESLCRLVIGEKVILWNSDWLEEGLKQLMESISVIDVENLNEIKSVIDPSEISPFIY